MRQIPPFAIVFAIVLFFARSGAAAEPPTPTPPPLPSHLLPHYDLDITFDANSHRALIRERVTWTNNTHTATDQLVF